MSSSPTPGIGGEAARSESKQGGPEGLRAFLHDAFRGGAELRQVRRSERPPLLRRPDVRAATVVPPSALRAAEPTGCARRALIMPSTDKERDEARSAMERQMIYEHLLNRGCASKFDAQLLSLIHI